MNQQTEAWKQKIKEHILTSLSAMDQTMTEEERNRYLQTLQEKIEEELLLTTTRTQSGLTDAVAYNQTVYELYLDVLTLFQRESSLSEQIQHCRNVNQGVSNILNTGLKNLERQLDQFEAGIPLNGNTFCYLEEFQSMENQETDRSFYTERYGEKMPLSVNTYFRCHQSNLTLNYTRKQNNIVYSSGIQMGSIQITKQYGKGFKRVSNPQTKLSNCIDTSEATYWNETILSDAPLTVQGLEYESGLDGKTSRSYYDLSSGALCEVCITFESLAKINEITLLPFGQFPMDLVAIRYSLSDDEIDSAYDIVTPHNAQYPWLVSTNMKQEVTFRFPEINCKKLYLLFNQQHYIKNTYRISSDQALKNYLWFLQSGRKEIEETDRLYPGMTKEKKMENPVSSYLESLSAMTGKDILSLLTQRDVSRTKTKYEYNYGLYNIAPEFVEYEKAGIYVSKEISIQHPIQTIRLYSEEEHFLGSHGEIVSDIEFYVTSKHHPTDMDWKPICPVNKTHVFNERLQLDYTECKLRHPAICTTRNITHPDGSISQEVIRPIVKMNDIVLIEDADYVLHFDETGNAISIEISNLDHFALYTVSYEPTPDAKEISFLDLCSVNRSTESFLGNKTCVYPLKEIPYFSPNDPNAYSTYLKIIDTVTGEIYVQNDTKEALIHCVTNKENPSESFLNFTKATNRFEYYTYGYALYLNRPLDSRYKLELMYPSYDSSVRVKIILRRNSKRDFWITPVLKSYRLEFTTL